MSDQATLDRARHTVRVTVRRTVRGPDPEPVQATRFLRPAPEDSGPHPETSFTADTSALAASPTKRSWFRRAVELGGRTMRRAGSYGKRVWGWFKGQDRRLRSDPEYRTKVSSAVAAGARAADRVPRVGGVVGGALRAAGAGLTFAY